MGYDIAVYKNKTAFKNYNEYTDDINDKYKYSMQCLYQYEPVFKQVFKLDRRASVCENLTGEITQELKERLLTGFEEFCGNKQNDMETQKTFADFYGVDPSTQKPVVCVFIGNTSYEKLCEYFVKIGQLIVADKIKYIRFF